jgi:hypothetical protein
MDKTWKEQTDTVTMHREDDGQKFEFHVISTFHERHDQHGSHVSQDKLKEIASPDGRGVYTPDEVNFYFEGEPDRPMRIVASGF